MFSLRDIPFSRVILYLLLIGLLPIIGIGYFYTKEKKAWTEVSKHLETVQHLTQVKGLRQAPNNLVRKRFTNANPLYIDQHLESLSLLSKEKKALEELFNRPAFTGDDVAENRYAFLAGETNRLLFAERGVEVAEGMRETLEVLTHPVELDMDDLTNLLDLIDGEHPDQPQLIVTDLKLQKNSTHSKTEVFELTLSLIKREFTTS